MTVISTNLNIQERTALSGRYVLLNSGLYFINTNLYDRICAGGYEWENINDSAEGLELYNEIVENHTPIDYCIVKLTTSKE